VEPARLQYIGQAAKGRHHYLITMDMWVWLRYDLRL
jgi:hypothetical protein